MRFYAIYRESEERGKSFLCKKYIREEMEKVKKEREKFLIKKGGKNQSSKTFLTA